MVESLVNSLPYMVEATKMVVTGTGVGDLLGRRDGGVCEVKDKARFLSERVGRIG